MFLAELEHPEFKRFNMSSLRTGIMAGALCPEALMRRVIEEMHLPELTIVYGLTETSPAVCMNPLDLPEYNGSIGLPIPSTDVSVQDDNGKILEMGEVGELCVRGPQVMKGYWQRPEETIKVLGEDGWLHTGDIAKIDEKGYVYIVDRKKDMILVSGFNVYPNEIEDVVAQHPGVLEVACIGVPDKNSGEAVKLFVVRKDPNLTAEQLLEYCKHELTAYKKPKFIEFRDELPKTNVGKILRRQLRDEKPKAAA
jgi:long-chain acyl-CoA synthetase